MLPLNSKIIELMELMKDWQNQQGLSDEITPHTLRHTFGSAQLRAGEKVEVVSKLLGHSSITITYNKYIHIIKEQEVKAMKMIEII